MTYLSVFSDLSLRSFDCFQSRIESDRTRVCWIQSDMLPINNGIVFLEKWNPKGTNGPGRFERSVVIYQTWKSVKVLLPGDRILKTLPSKGKLRLGPGTQITEQKQVISTHVGILNQTKNGKLWLQTTQKRQKTTFRRSFSKRTFRYVPAIEERVIGIVHERNAEVGMHSGILNDGYVAGFLGGHW